MMEDNKMKGEARSDTITIKKDALWKYSTFILAGLLVLAIVFFVLPGKSTTGNVVAGNNNPTLPTNPGERANIEVGNAAVLGSKSASVTMIEYSDLQCPFCSRFHLQGFAQIKQNYIDNGKIQFVYKNFPLEQIHPVARDAARAILLVREKGGDDAYWKMIDKIFENQQSLSKESLKTWAKELGQNIDTELDSDKYNDEVDKDLSEGASIGVQGTPAFFINGREISGACPFDTFDKAIKAELNGKDWVVTQCQFAKL